MPTFQYKARKSNGETEIDTVEAASQDQAVNILQQKGLMVLSVSRKETAKEDREISGTTYKIKYHNRIRSKDLILFATQLATTLDANIPLLKCIEIQLEQTTSRKFRAILEDIHDNVRKGHSLKDSLAKHPRVFSNMWIHLVETGETSGQLPRVFYQLVDYLVSKNNLKRKTMTALIYPAALIFVCIVAIYVFTVKIIPIFANIFKDFNMELPLLTRAVLGISGFLQRNILLTIIAVAILGYIGYRYVKTEQGRKIFDRLTFKIPVFGSFILNTSIEKFASSLGVLLHSGIPILQALDIVAKISDNKIIEQAVTEAKINVKEGKSLSSSLARSGVFPPLPVSMCSVGEETGQLDKMLEQVTKYYREELTVFVDRLSAALEPIVIITMGSVVFILVLAMYLPIFEMAVLGT